ncbi:MAG: hypothetical protein WC450_12630 [Candidatus Omnitrophota bacterium]|jgi:hypothetical protein
MEKFEDWRVKHKQEIAEVQALLNISLPEFADPIFNDLRKLEAYYSRVQSIVSWADYYLEIACKRELERVIREGTEKLPSYEKEVQTKAATAPERLYRNLAQGLLDTIKQRIFLGMNRTNYCKDLYVNSAVKGRE